MVLRREVHEAIEKIVPSEYVKYGEPMKKHTTFRIGGEAACVIWVENEKQLAALFRLCKEEAIPYLVMGNGSNLLFSDEGFDGIIFLIGSRMQEIQVEGTRITAKAGAMMSRIASVAKDHSLTGLEFASGIPGTIGGGVVMNAGAYGGELKDVIIRVRVMDPDGKARVVDHTQMHFGYRTSLIKEEPLVVLEVEMELAQGNQAEIQEKMEELAAKRKEKQPLEYPSAGSTFKRPEGYFAGALIQEAGLRGYSIGDAQVSEKHCGFVINRGNASCEDVKKLMQHVIKVVEEKNGVTLEPEVILVSR